MTEDLPSTQNRHFRPITITECLALKATVESRVTWPKSRLHVHVKCALSMSELAMMLQSKIIPGEESVFRYPSKADFNQ